MKDMGWGIVWLLLAGGAAADTWQGRFDAVEVRAEGTRFSVRGQGLHLYAAGAYRDVLLAGFFHQAVFRVDYTPFPCGGGLAGTCGTVYGVTVQADALR